MSPCLVLLSVFVANIAQCWSTEIYFTDGETALMYDVDVRRTVKACSSIPVSYVEEQREIRDPNIDIQDVSEKEMTVILRDCLKQDEDIDYLTRTDRSLFIYEGTKWCGIGNIAANDNDLGEMRITDACCRTHDKCRPYMKAFACKEKFCNTIPWSRFQCSCDNALFDCLKAASKTNETKTANSLGYLYFDLLGTKCYEYGTFKKCVKTGWLGIGCKKYEMSEGWHWVKPKKEFCSEGTSC